MPDFSFVFIHSIGILHRFNLALKFHKNNLVITFLKKQFDIMYDALYTIRHLKFSVWALIDNYLASHAHFKLKILKYSIALKAAVIY